MSRVSFGRRGGWGALLLGHLAFRLSCVPFGRGGGRDALRPRVLAFGLGCAFVWGLGGDFRRRFFCSCLGGGLGVVGWCWVWLGRGFRFRGWLQRIQFGAERCDGIRRQLAIDHELVGSHDDRLHMFCRRRFWRRIRVRRRFGLRGRRCRFFGNLAHAAFWECRLQRPDVARRDAEPRQPGVGLLHGLQQLLPFAFDGIALGVVVGIVVGYLLRGGTQTLQFHLLSLSRRLALALLGDAFPRHAVEALVAAPGGALDDGEDIHLPDALHHRSADAGARILQESGQALFGIGDAGCGGGRTSLILGLAQFDSCHCRMGADVVWQFGQVEETTCSIGLHVSIVEPCGDGGRVRKPCERGQTDLVRCIFPEHAA